MRFAIILTALLLFPAGFVFAAETQIDASVDVTTAAHNGSSPTVVFTSDNIGYAFYSDSAGTCAYSKTINGGSSWGTPVTVDAQTDCNHIAVWYDGWTPGISGGYIHISTMDAADLWYNRLEVSSDTLLLGSTPVNASGANQAGVFTAAANTHSITMGTDGDVYMGVQDAGDSFVVKCSASCDTADNWTEAGLVSPFDLDEDWLILMPLSGENILAIRWDISGNAIQSKVYNDTLNTWDVLWANVDSNALENTTYDAAFGATLKRSTGDMYLAYAGDYGTLGTDDDIRTAVYSGGAWTAKTNVLTNDTKGITGVKIAIDDNTADDVYVVYSARATAGTAATGNIYYKKSSDGMATWGTEQGPINTTAGDLYGSRVNIISDQRIYVTWDLPSADDILGTTIADLAPPAITVGSAGTQTVNLTIPSADAYVGGAFTFLRDNESANVTQIIISETGTVNANTNLSDVKLYYKAQAACDSALPGDATLFNSSAGTFSGSEKAALTGTMSVNGTQVCVYVQMDIGSGAIANDTLEIEIANPSADIAVSAGGILPATSVAISGTTTLISNNAPAAPTNVSPPNSTSVVTLTPMLEASAYSDNESDTHAATQWQVTAVSGDYSSSVFDFTSSTGETSRVIPADTLLNATTYYWRVRYRDNFNATHWSNYSTETSFLTANNAPAAPTNISPINGTSVTTLTPMLEASTYSDPESDTHAATQWQVTSTPGDYSSPVFNFTSITAETSRVITASTLSNTATYYWHVRYRDNINPTHWSNYSTETSFITALTQLSIKIEALSGKTEYFIGDNVPLDVQVTNFTTGSPINDAAVTVSVFDPSGTKIITDQAMAYISNSSGIYRYTMVNPTVNGTYVYEIKAVKSGQSGYGAANFQVGALASTKALSESIQASQQKISTATLSDVGNLELGKTYRAKLTLENFESELTDSFSLPTITIYDSLRNVLINSLPMTKINDGTYEFTYLTGAGQVSGLWEAAVSIPVTSTNTISRNDYFQVTGAPAQVKINSIRDSTVPSITANITITNEGNAAFEYHYEYCIVAEQPIQCIGVNALAYGLGAKLIQPGEDFTTDLILQVSNPGTYYFKVGVYWGTERSGAALQFQAKIQTLQVQQSPGGGGGGPAPEPAKPPSISLEQIWNLLASLLTQVTGAGQKIGVIESRLNYLERIWSQLQPQIQPSKTAAPAKAAPISKIKPVIKIRIK
ncbi:MAG: hypothetical protein A2742_02050 [Candidatus Yanofskybacteria bacterium RIFCSPHIGHO2_01_FULL_43_32]|uniref:Fibronectin type-III domain-containing protein n=1 Tax=Candidatus Wildermuthbacteria bacterium RIFCSPLOWO2_01_FULL_48_35 TaxID=1802463 RepID=A0A1G2RS16_9BACT|nr:MAG: hypothetical protein A2742_02050 [Candidatus Yanofskybacteria bacterium RIFCSPHIGHO2_01_FULL_43_32]OHA74831.1 MAG: hypothetical protein A3A32_03190 [Candidatus Wildermuthbacteria bacterium RIFCSPLOWO2_01_FULL_48_35]